MGLPRVECVVVFASEGLQLGEYANAFRVVADSSAEVLLDFCVYSAATNVAKVVSRVRVQRAFLGFIDARLREALHEFAVEPGDAFYDLQDGHLLLLASALGDDN